MYKKILCSLLLFILIIPCNVMASISSLVMVGGKYYDSLEEAVANASSNDTITLISDVTLEDTLDINKTVNINLNGNDITAPSMVFRVNGGVLNITGSGTIKETEPNYGAIAVIGSTDPSDSNYSIASVDKDVKLEGWSGIFITHDNYKSYGVVVNLDGDITATDDVSGGTGIGVYVNGNIKDEENAPVINIGDDVEITSTGNGLYIAGYATFNIGKANISGVESGIGIKAGNLNIDGAKVISTGQDKTPTNGYNNGIMPSGSTIQIESSTGYAGNINIDISSGTFTSKNSYVIYEYIGSGSSTKVEDINISGGTFKSNSKDEVFELSDSFKNTHKGFITGGEYSSNPSNYLSAGYTTSINNDMYRVISSTLKLVTGDNIKTNTGNGFIIFMVSFVILVIISIMGYINRDKLISLLRK